MEKPGASIERRHGDGRTAALFPAEFGPALEPHRRVARTIPGRAEKSFTSARVPPCRRRHHSPKGNSRQYNCCRRMQAWTCHLAKRRPRGGRDLRDWAAGRGRVRAANTAARAEASESCCQTPAKTPISGTETGGRR